MSNPLLSCMDKIEGVVVHRDSDSRYIVALRPREWVRVLFGDGTLFSEESVDRMVAGVQRVKVAKMEVFRELKRIESMARQDGVCASGVQLVFSSSSECGSKGTPDGDLMRCIRGEPVSSTLGGTLTEILVQEVWGRDLDAYCVRLRLD